MNTIELMGGLGNQLFQIFTIISYSIREDKQFYFEDKIITCGWRKKIYWDTPLLEKLKVYVKNIITIRQGASQSEDYERDNIYNEPCFNYINIPSYNDVKLFGYFQSDKYFKDHKDTIFDLIKLNDTQYFISEKYKNDIPSYDNIISIHFRIGDYKHQECNHPILPLKYYEEALLYILSNNPNKIDWTILYFCEEEDINCVNNKINILKNNIHFSKLTFIKINNIKEDWEQMIVMSLCYHNIIANSTFSWWGAYFNKNDNIIIYPKIWFGSNLNHNVSDLFPEKWIKI